MRRRDVLRTAGLAALPLISRTARARSRVEDSLPANTHPGSYRPYGTLSLRGAKDAVVAGDGTTVYVAVTDGFAAVDISAPADPTLLAERRGILAERKNGPLPQIHDVKVDGDTLLVVGPAHGGSDVLRGAARYDVSDPANPTRTGFHETDFPIHNSFLADGIAYLTLNTSEATALVLVDVSGDVPTEVGRWSITDHEDAWKDVSPFIRTMHDVSVHGDVAYLAHWDAGTWLLDVSDPANPTVLSQVGGLDPAELKDADARSAGYQLPGNSHYAAVNDDATVLGVNAEAWDVPSDDDTAGGPGGIDLYDITDLTAPTKLAHIDPPPTPDPTLSGVWTTSHNFDFHGDRLYTSWYQGGVKIHDVSDPTAPQELAWWRKPDETSFWTAQHASGCFVGSSRADPSADSGSGAGAALYTFPDHPGVQENPPSLTTTTTTTTTTRTTTATPTVTTTETSTSTETTATETPGLGGLSAIAALGAAGLAVWRERYE